MSSLDASPASERSSNGSLDSANAFLASSDAAEAHAPTPASSRELEALYRSHGEFVWRSLARLGVPSSALEDALHDVFVVAARRWGEFRGDASPKTWLFSIAIRVTQSHRRSVARHLRRVEALELAHANGNSHRPASAKVDAQRTLVLLLDQLSDEQRQVYVLMEMEGMTGLEAARTLDVNPNTVSTRLRSARSKIQQVAREMMSPQEAGRGGVHRD